MNKKEKTGSRPLDHETNPETSEIGVPEKSGLSIAEMMHVGLDIPSPFMRDIFLKKQKLVGMRFQGGSDGLMEELTPGSRVFFVAEPENKFDSCAVAAVDAKGRKLGYIPRNENDIVFALLKVGKSFYGIVSEEQPYTNLRLNITPGVLVVDMYMREFLLPDDMSTLPRQGCEGSYAVVSACLPKKSKASGGRGNAPAYISSVFVIKVINGRERDSYYGRVSEKNAAGSERELLRRFQTFTGYLPIVGHDIEKKVVPALEDAYGVLLGMPFSNRVIDTLPMAWNHLPDAKYFTLKALARKLNIRTASESEEEENCRKTWELYCIMDRS